MLTTSTILIWPNPVLSEVSAPVEATDDLEKLLDVMWHTMYVNNGVGLSANQIGVKKRLFIMDTGLGFHGMVFVNPKVVKTSAELLLEDEGCLSVPGIYEKVKRPSWVVVEALDEKRVPFTVTLVGIEARCALHEMEHLDGHFFLEHIPKAKRDKVKKKLKGLK